VIASISEEVLLHHVALHACGCAPEDLRPCWCPCRHAIAFVCASCGEPVLLAVDPTCEPCVHAQELLAERGLA
jgi:hypothetical protein